MFFFFQESSEDNDNIFNITKDQFENGLYIKEREKRLTSSNFGKVIKIKKATSRDNILKSLIYPSSINNWYMEYGKSKESVAIQIFERQIKKKIKKSGLIIDKDNHFLAATPDGK